MARERTITLKILGDGSSANRMLRGMNTQSSSFGKTVSHMGVLVRRAAVVGIGALGAGLAYAVKEGAEAVRVTAKTRAVIKSTGGVANVSAKHVDKLANSILNYSGESDEAIASAQNVLLTFKDVRNEVGEGNKIFDEATKRVVDMSVALGKDFQSSAIMVGKALNDPIGGVTALTRAGVQFTDAQKEQIGTLVESGRKLDAQKVFLGELESQFGGTARAVGNKEPWRVLWGQIGNVSEELGKELLPYARDFSNWAIDHLPGAVEGVKDFAKGAAKWFGDAKDSLGDFLADVDKSLGGTGAGEGFTATFEGIKSEALITADAVGGTFSDMFTKTIDELRESGVEFTGPSAWIAGVFDGAQEGAELFAELLERDVAIMSGLVDGANQLRDALGDAFTGNSNFGEIAGALYNQTHPSVPNFTGGTSQPSTANEPRGGSSGRPPRGHGSHGGEALMRTNIFNIDGSNRSDDELEEIIRRGTNDDIDRDERWFRARSVSA